VLVPDGNITLIEDVATICAAPIITSSSSSSSSPSSASLTPFPLLAICLNEYTNGSSSPANPFNEIVNNVDNEIPPIDGVTVIGVDDDDDGGNDVVIPYSAYDDTNTTPLVEVEVEVDDEDEDDDDDDDEDEDDDVIITVHRNV
jgi:hypothetical protein